MPHALIIDDDASESAALAELVADEGFTTSVTGSLAEARERLRNAPDVILLDLVLPDGIHARVRLEAARAAGQALSPIDDPAYFAQ